MSLTTTNSFFTSTFTPPRNNRPPSQAHGSQSGQAAAASSAPPSAASASPDSSTFLNQFQPLMATMPPILCRPNNFPSPRFVMNMANALDNVPLRLRKAVSDWGYKILTAASFSDTIKTLPVGLQPEQMINKLLPPAVLKQAQKYLTYLNWGVTRDSMNPDFPKTIRLPETGWTCLWFTQHDNKLFPADPDLLQHLPKMIVHRFEFLPQPISRPGYAILHELGHAVDDVLGTTQYTWTDDKAHFLSGSDKFTEAYQADIQAINTEMDRQFFEYYLPRPDNPQDSGGEARKEAFAELFARLQSSTAQDSPAEREEDTFYVANFPHTADFIRQHVLAPWQKPAPKKKDKRAPLQRHSTKQPNKTAPP
jgi:hypothetical protein